MKKLILSVAAILAFGVVSAQETKFGAKAGLNLANFGGDAEDASMLVGFHVGGFAEIMVSDKFAVQPELLLSTQGAKEEFSESFGGFNFSSESTTNLMYLNIPIMAKYYVTEAFNIQAGPQVGFLMSAKADYSETEDGETFTADGVDVKDSFESIDFGFNIGVGYSFGENLGVEARYNMGLSDISKEEEVVGVPTPDFKVNNQVIQLSFLYKF